LLRDCAGADSVSDDEGRMPDVDRLAGRLDVRFDVRLDVRRTDARGRAVLVRDLETAEPDLRADERLTESGRDSDIAISPDLAGVERAAVREVDLDDDLERAVDRRTGDRRAGDAAAAGFADCMVLAAVISAFAAVVIALVAVFIDCIADDIVRADAVALVAAVVILLAAEVTLVAAEETPLAAVAGVVALRLDALLRVAVLRLVPPRLAVLRLPALRLAVLRRVPVDRDAVERDAVEREAVDRDAVLRFDRDAVLRGVLAAVPRAGFAALLRRLADDDAEDVPEPGVDFDRLAVPRDALRLTGLLRAELAELRRVAARVVDDTGTEIPPS
jgi:hypothetical protein